ncbi:hypothetical protein V5799_003567 [Amblyomma americanum]|uniref:Carboxylesterase type B domain-containing protein n=1 Tax=Amblyomma americanum TaxID=6943 RepID=A0AAQ4D8L7_AMBAM
MDTPQGDRRKHSRSHRRHLSASVDKQGSASGFSSPSLSPPTSVSSTDEEQVQSGERVVPTTASPVQAASSSRGGVAHPTRAVTSPRRSSRDIFLGSSTPDVDVKPPTKAVASSPRSSRASSPRSSRDASLGSSPMNVNLAHPTKAPASPPRSSRHLSLGSRPVDGVVVGARPTQAYVAKARSSAASPAHSSDDTPSSTNSPDLHIAHTTPLKSCLTKTPPECVDSGITDQDKGPRSELTAQAKPRFFFFACASVVPFVLLVIVGTMYTRRTPRLACRDGVEDLLVKTTLGLLKGNSVEVENGLEARAFLGIPFGVGVSGQQRFGIAWEVKKLDSPFAADIQGPACLQPEVSMPGLRPITATSDDCLSLNVWTPRGCSLKGESLPVLFFISAWLSHGVSWNGLYDWRHLASRGRVVVVAPNFRLGAVGFLHRNGIGPENLGVQDILAAWRWTREHIASFGGDAENVVPVGHGSGGFIVSALLTRPELLEANKAIILSQSMLAPLPDNSGAVGLATTKRIGQLCCDISPCVDDSVSGGASLQDRNDWERWFVLDMLNANSYAY